MTEIAFMYFADWVNAAPKTEADTDPIVAWIGGDGRHGILVDDLATIGAKSRSINRETADFFGEHLYVLNT